MTYRNLIEEFISVARAAYPCEACGLIYIFKGKPKLFVCENVADNPREDFMISDKQFSEAESYGEVVAVVHSHPNGTAQPSGADVVAHRASGLAWWIVGLETADAEADIVELPACGALPLIGRTFHHGVVDCFTLIRDYYRMERGVALPDFERRDDWWHKGENLYVDNYARAGFFKVGKDETILVGDVLLMNVDSNVPNHAAIYLGNGVILHHLHGRLSSREVYTTYYRDRTQYVLRFGRN